MSRLPHCGLLSRLGAIWTSAVAHPPFCGAFASLVLSLPPDLTGAEPQCSLCPSDSVSSPAHDSVYLAKVSAGDRLSSAGPHPKGKLRHRGRTCPKVILEVCGDCGHLVRPKAEQISSWEGHGGGRGVTPILHSCKAGGWGKCWGTPTLPKD